MRGSATVRWPVWSHVFCSKPWRIISVWEECRRGLWRHPAVWDWDWENAINAQWHVKVKYGGWIRGQSPEEKSKIALTTFPHTENSIRFWIACNRMSIYFYIIVGINKQTWSALSWKVLNNYNNTSWHCLYTGRGFVWCLTNGHFSKMSSSSRLLVFDSDCLSDSLFSSSLLQSSPTRWQYRLQPRLCPKWRATRYSSLVRCHGPQCSTLTYRWVGTCGLQRTQPPHLRSWSPCQETLFCALEDRIDRGWRLGTSGWIKPAPLPTGWPFTSCSRWTRACFTARLPSGSRTLTAAGLPWPASRATRLSSAFSPLVSNGGKAPCKREGKCWSTLPSLLTDTEASMRPGYLWLLICVSH